MSTMELGDRLVQVRSTVKPEKDLFTQNDDANCMPPCGMSMWGQENVPQGCAVIQCRIAKVMLDLLGPYCANRIEYALLKCLDGRTVLLLCIYCVFVHVVVTLCIFSSQSFSCPDRQE